MREFTTFGWNCGVKRRREKKMKKSVAMSATKVQCGGVKWKQAQRKPKTKQGVALTPEQREYVKGLAAHLQMSFSAVVGHALDHCKRCPAAKEEAK